jgi:hypothetical protein
MLRAFGAEKLSLLNSIINTEGPGIFQPTATSAFLLREAKSLIFSNADLLDLGCGWGIVGLELALNTDLNLSLSDASQSATQAAEENCRILKLKAEVKCGSLFEPWEGSKFDLIVNDVSGVSTDIPFSNVWFDGIPFASGPDGTDLTIDVIAKAPKFLKENGSVLLPAISLSNVSKLETAMGASYSEIQLLSTNYWQLEISNLSHGLALSELKSRGIVDFERNGNTFTFYTKIYRLRNPR